MPLSFLTITGLVLTVLSIIIVGTISGKKVNNARDFSTGSGRASTWIVCGAIMGTLVSGQATIGTAQLAFSYGISAWWFTLGSALGCLILSIAYVIPLRHSGNITLLEIVSKEYGKNAETLGSLLCFLGMFISIIAQVLSAAALLQALFPINFLAAALISIALMVVYVVFGGVWGAGMGGIVKLALLYVSAIVGGIAVFGLTKGYSNLMDTLQAIFIGTPLGETYQLTEADAICHRYQNLLARGPMKDMGSCMSLILGVLATQTYAQGIWAGKNDSVARKGSMLCALLTPPIGIACILIGLYMRSHYITIDEFNTLGYLPAGIHIMESSAQAFPLFVLNHLPHLFGGIVLGTLLITIIGGGSGLSLGAATILVRDVFSRFKPNIKESKNNLVVTRLTIVLILVLGVASAASFSGSFINDLGFLSMGLRATAVFLPLTFALFLPKQIHPKWILTSMIAGTSMLLTAKFAGLPGDPMWWGLGMSLLCCCAGLRTKTVR